MNTEVELNLEPVPLINKELTDSHDSLQVKNVAVQVIMTIAVVFALNWAQAFIVTLLLGILLSYALNPMVNWLERIKVKRPLGSTIVILGLITGMVFTGLGLSNQVESIINKLPDAAAKISSSLVNKRGDPLTNIQKVQIAATQVETATSSEDSNSGKNKKTTMHVVIDTPKFKIGNYLWRSSLGFFGFVGETITMIFLAYFLLLSGDTFKRKLVRLTGPSLSRKKITVIVLEQINSTVQRYMLMLIVTNVMVGVLMWIALRLFGLENAGAWSVAAGVIHVIPYFGPIVTAGVLGMVAYMQFNSLLIALLIASTSMLIATIVGVFVTTWMTGRIAKMNSAAIFISLLFFTWLWGVWGMLLGIPLIVIMKVVCEHVDHLKPISELLGV
ncbi:MAG: AI-2E family transporter [Methylophilaceae bacterium]|nr:AI-2E family transporter [Methylophilaceae bacterium]